MVKDFSQRESERAAQEAKAEKARAEADQRTKAHAEELEQKIANYIKEKGVSGIQIGVDRFTNNVMLTRSTGTCTISMRADAARTEMLRAPIDWQYSVDQKRKGGTAIENVHDSLDNDGLKEDQMIDRVCDWLKRT